MTDIVEEARAMLAQATPGPWFITGNEIASDRGFVARGPSLGDIRAPGGRDDAELIAAAPRLLAALADECERLRIENARHVDFRVSINEALPRQFGVTAIGAIAELRTENARLREAMPTDGDRDVLDSLYRATVELVTGGGMFPASARAEDELAKARAWLARLDAAKGVR